ncbi:flagellar basal body P-ring formation chaperone FlgA [Stappia sp. ES.058]|uniref:flagellar basal body P-ring formation chaperone FlgA n=1 Tax=Stappia sp. ES.058 TaxID=1881061 RepID=UPI00087B5536|nr:flagellar basal body P-ring formation chaperone FlgA [Stappia sp. ES.058]SDU24346.1 flagella basal body P-ring formation protein FlgA [Stappia sp. ES.058]
MIRQTLIAAAVLFLAAGQAIAAGALRSHVAVTADVVTVGDFYPDAGRFATTPLFRAPDLGTSGPVPAAVVADRARAAGYLDAQTDGLRHVVVERLAVTIGMPQLEAAVREALAARYPDAEHDLLEVSLRGFPGTLQAATGTHDPVSVTSVTWRRASGQLTASLRINAGTQSRTANLTGRAMEMAQVYALARPLDRGAVVRAGDLIVKNVPRTRLTARHVENPEEVVGLAARRGIQADRPLREADFEPPLLVKRGSKVTLVFKTAGLTLTTIGRALANGAEGDIVDILNLQSRRTVSGIVRAHDQVEVGLVHRRIAQLQETN